MTRSNLVKFCTLTGVVMLALAPAEAAIRRVDGAGSCTPPTTCGGDWIAAFERLESLMKEQEAGAEEVRDLFRVQGILEDASRLAINIGYYLETIERVRRFEEATANPALRR